MDLSGISPWAAGNYALGAEVKSTAPLGDGHSHAFQCTHPGYSGAEPAWNIGSGSITPNGVLMWLEIGSDASPPAAPLLVDPGAFVLLFTAAEYAAIETAAQSDAIIGQYLTSVQAAAVPIDLSGSITQNGIFYLVAKGLLTSARAAAILSDTPHS